MAGSFLGDALFRQIADSGARAPAWKRQDVSRVSFEANFLLPRAGPRPSTLASFRQCLSLKSDFGPVIPMIETRIVESLIHPEPLCLIDTPP